RGSFGVTTRATLGTMAGTTGRRGSVQAAAWDPVPPQSPSTAHGRTYDAVMSRLERSLPRLLAEQERERRETEKLFHELAALAGAGGAGGPGGKRFPPAVGGRAAPRRGSRPPPRRPGPARSPPPPRRVGGGAPRRP